PGAPSPEVALPTWWSTPQPLLAHEYTQLPCGERGAAGRLAQFAAGGVWAARALVSAGPAGCRRRNRFAPCDLPRGLPVDPRAGPGCGLLAGGGVEAMTTCGWSLIRHGNVTVSPK